MWGGGVQKEPPPLKTSLSHSGQECALIRSAPDPGTLPAEYKRAQRDGREAGTDEKGARKDRAGDYTARTECNRTGAPNASRTLYRQRESQVAQGDPRNCECQGDSREARRLKKTGRPAKSYPHITRTPSEMDPRAPLFSGLLLFLLLQLQVARCGPIYDLSPTRELDSLKNILERLEEKFSLMETLESSPDLQEPGLQGALQEEPSEDSESLQLEPRVAPGGAYNIKDSLLKGLRSLQNPKMVRDSGCFGRRIDRIGSMSGMGCNGPRKN